MGALDGWGLSEGLRSGTLRLTLGSCAVLGKPLSVASAFCPLLETGAHHFSALGCGRIKEMTHGKYLAQSLALNEQEILPLTLSFPLPSLPPSTTFPACLLPMASCSLDTLRQGLGRESTLWLYPASPSPGPERGIHGLRSEPRLSCVIPSSVWAISFPAQEWGPAGWGPELLGPGPGTLGPQPTC